MAEFSTEQRSDLSRRGLAMPDGSFPIRNKSDLRNAISSYGRAKNPDAVKRWIIRRARELNALDMLPESWNVAQHSDILAHYGVKGMKWGVRKARKRAAKENVSGRSKYSTGKNYDKVYSSYQKEKQSIAKKYRSQFQKLINDTVRYNALVSAGQRNPKERQRLAKENARLNNEYYKETTKLGRKYVDQFNRATLNDIGYENVDKGMEALNRLKKKDKYIFDFEI